MSEKSQEMIKKSLDTLKTTCENALLENTKALIEVFSTMDEKTQLREMGQGRVAVSCLDHIVEMVQGLSNERRKEMIEKFPELDILFMHSLGYLELGLVFGYTEKKSKEDK